MAATFTISNDEAISIIRKHMGLPEYVVIKIDQQDIKSDDPAPKDADGWVLVPVDWEKMYHPAQAETYDKIEVMYQDYSTDFGEPTCWNVSWSRNTTNAIIKYREVK